MKGALSIKVSVFRFLVEFGYRTTKHTEHTELNR